MIVKDQASSSRHWYDLQGNPAYTIKGKDGKDRATTLRDARKHNLVPSVTTILNLVAKPGLDTWKQQQVLLSALTLHRKPDELEQAWLERVMMDSKETGKAAAERGTLIHAQIESYFKKPYLNPEQYVVNTQQAVNDMFPNENWIHEKSFAHIDGFGGKVDLHSSNVVLDFKTTEKDVDSITPYFEQIMQLAAYKEGLMLNEKATVGNVYVNHFNNKVKIIIHDDEEVKQALECFHCLLLFYRLKNKLIDK